MDHTHLALSAHHLEEQYLANDISLNALVHRAEALLEQGKSLLSAERHGRAMNCVYGLEEINALVLDEGRALRADERLRVTTKLRNLVSLL